MSAVDLFKDSQQTPANLKPPSTPSMTPSRSVKRRSSAVNKLPATIAPKKETVTYFSQPCDFKDFYDLRTRQVPLSNGINGLAELWAQYGIHEPNSSLTNNPEHHTVMKDEKVSEEYIWSKKQTSKCLVLQLIFLMILSAFLGAMCFALTEHYFLNTSSCSSPLQIVQNVEKVRPVDKSLSLQLENKILHLSEEIKYLKDHLSRKQENVGSEVIASSQKGILEELLTADLACSGNLGTVVATPDTTTVTVPAVVTLLGIFSFQLQMNHKHPHTTIDGLIQEVGDCWPFEGSRGRLVLKLHRRSLLTGVSVSHIPPAISATGDISSAPRYFQVLVHQRKEDLENGQVLGKFEYKTSGAWRQTFPLESVNSEENLFDIVEFRFLENHGNPNFTCVYRVHVHGKTP